MAELSGDPLLGDGPSSEVVTVDGLERGRGAVVQSMRRAFGAFVGACTPGELASIPAIGPGR